jgi:hypothetical protein
LNATRADTPCASAKREAAHDVDPYDPVVARVHAARGYPLQGYVQRCAQRRESDSPG